MISPAYPLVLAALAAPVAPTSATTTDKNAALSVRQVSNAAEAHVEIGRCRTSPIACFNLYTKTIYIRPELFRVLSSRTCRRDRPRRIATFILAHEAGHAHGIYTESGANSYATTHFSTVRKRLGFPPRLDRRIPSPGGISSAWLQIAGQC